MTWVKICGITNLDDALAAVEAGADLLGFIFYEASPRDVKPEVVKEIVSRITHHISRITFVGVFVKASLETITHTLDYCQFDLAQLHGDESPEFVHHFQGRAFKALRPQSLQEAEDFIQKYQPSIPTPRSASLLPTPYFLLDAYHPTLYGGAGQVTDWTMAAAIARQYPILLAGGLTPDNVAEAVRAVKPWGVDVSSGVEASKGRKDHDKVRRFVEAAKSVES
jgi:phosphoribosylanthranilate isomerase